MSQAINIKCEGNAVTNSVIDIVTKVPPILEAYSIDLEKIMKGDKGEIEKLKELRRDDKKVKKGKVVRDTEKGHT